MVNDVVVALSATLLRLGYPTIGLSDRWEGIVCLPFLPMLYSINNLDKQQVALVNLSLLSLI